VVLRHPARSPDTVSAKPSHSARNLSYVAFYFYSSGIRCIVIYALNFKSSNVPAIKYSRYLDRPLHATMPNKLRRNVRTCISLLAGICGNSSTRPTRCVELFARRSIVQVLQLVRLLQRQADRPEGQTPFNNDIRNRIFSYGNYLCDEFAKRLIS